MTEPAAGNFAGNIGVFCRALQARGIPVTAAQVVTAFRALAAVGLSRREDVYFALRAALVSDARHFAGFRQLFDAVFAVVPPANSPANAPSPETVSADAPTASLSVVSKRLLMPIAAAGEEPTGTGTGGGSSTAERLGRKDFEAMDPAELRRAAALVAKMALTAAPVPSRRFVATPTGRTPDLRRSIRCMMRTDGEPLTLARKTRRRRSSDCVLLCDVSASMNVYSRVFLQFAHALTARRPGTWSFVFATRLTEISSLLKAADVDPALGNIARVASDMDGGTRIAASLETFNRRWLRRLPLHESSVILLSDGLERNSSSDLEFQIARLHRSCRQLIWLNPLLRYSHFEPKAHGIRRMLPHVDQFIPAHNLDSIAAMVQILNQPASQRSRAQR